MKGVSVPEYDPWSIVTLVMKHLAEEGVKKRFTFDEGDPGKAASELLLALGVQPVRTTEDDKEPTA